MTSRLVLQESHLQFLRYLLIGSSGAMLDLVLFMGLVNLLDVAPVPATSLSVLAGITNNYLLNARFTFSVAPGSRSRYLRFLTVGLLGLVLSAVLLHVFVVVLGAGPELVKVVSMPVILAFQFLLNKHWTFA